MQSILKKKNPINNPIKKKKKKVRSSKQTFLQRRHSDGQETHEKMFNITNYWASRVAYLLKNPPAMQETPVQSVGQENPLEKG